MSFSIPTHVPCKQCAEGVFHLVGEWLKRPEYTGITIGKPQSATVSDNSGSAYTIDIIHGGDNLGVIAIMQNPEITFITWKCYTTGETHPIEVEGNCSLLDKIIASKKANDEDGI